MVISAFRWKLNRYKNFGPKFRLFGKLGKTSPVLTAAVLTCVPVPASAEILLRFGVYLTDRPTVVVRQFRPVLSILESALTIRHGEPVRITTKVARTYEAGIEDLVNGRVDFSRLGPASYLTTKARNANVTILAMETDKGKKVFHGVIAVHKDGTIRSVKDLKGRTFAFGDRNSTIGRYLSQVYLLDHGIRGSDLGGYEYLGRHDRVGYAVALKKFDAGALKEGTFRKLVASGRPIRALATFPNVTKPWVARGGLPGELIASLRRELLKVRDPDALKALKHDGFTEGSDKDYATIRRAMKLAGAFAG